MIETPNFSFHDVGVDAFKKFENTFVIWPYEDQIFVDTKNMCMYVCMYICLFVCYICVSVHLEASKMWKYFKEWKFASTRQKMTHSLAHLTFLVDDDEHVHACLVVEKLGIDYCQALRVTIWLEGWVDGWHPTCIMKKLYSSQFVWCY